MASNTPQESSPAASLFQKAHGRMVMLQRIDEQLESLLDQRRRIHSELRDVQMEINTEFERVIKTAEEPPAKILSQFGDIVTGSARRPRMEIAEEAA
jgi:hypothetical protein